MNMTAPTETEEVVPIVAPLTGAELSACLAGLLGAVERKPALLLDQATLLTVRLALTAAQNASRGPQGGPEVPGLREQVERLQAHLSDAQEDVRMQGLRVLGLQREVQNTETRATSAEKIVEMIEQALVGEGEPKFTNEIANEVRRTVNTLEAAQTEIDALQQVAMRLNPAISTEEFAALGAKAARTDELDAEVQRLRRDHLRHTNKFKGAMRAAIGQVFANYEWAGRHRRHKNSVCCPICAGLKPVRGGRSSGAYGHTPKCGFVHLHTHVMAALST